jgi:alkylhydroperoxidase/carboxymuconolactone decarboxylase family protein YurZ
MDSDALTRRLDAAAYSAREAGLTDEEILEIVRAASARADAARPRAAEALEDYRRRFGSAAA